MKKVTTNFQIKPYLPKYYVQLRKILQQAGLFDKKMDTKTGLREKIKRDSESILVALIDNKLVGSIFIMEDGRMALLFRLAVKKDYREQGIGTQLMQEAEKRVKKACHSEVFVLAEEKNTSLKNFYKKRGYKEYNLYRGMGKKLRGSKNGKTTIS